MRFPVTKIADLFSKLSERALMEGTTCILLLGKNIEWLKDGFTTIKDIDENNVCFMKIEGILLWIITRYRRIINACYPS